jgi:UPF0755 protein
MKGLVWVVVLALLAAGGAGWVLEVPFGPGQETFVEIPSGMGTVGIARALKAGGVIRSKEAFELYRKATGGTLKAGEYRFEGPLKLGEVYRKIARGEVYTKTLVVPEGFNLFDIAAAVEQAGLGPSAEMLAAERRDVGLIADLNPGAVSLEGYLFPSTYQFGRRATPDQMVAAMVKRFRVAAAQLGLLGRPGLARTVTLASLIEKEVRVDAERPLVGGVFENRLRVGMPLATDPSVIYAAMLEGRWRGTIYQSDLQSQSPYNTYRHAGLPPGPIANPGVAALQAAMHPAVTDYLYFVADAAGHSQFSVDLKGHAAQVQAYRKAVGGAR